ncbi:MAG: PH domain-containing protein [Candidatus Pacebacteria bacterium]|nr:PH domain-containing protein [Candidatus Paceibacterota bacterium]PIR59971.1 MAG: hypothetical protein COU67_04280 [Candidatus Pacebacteria bacterium CG10_big_fil_rev_8_21_14_0_10_44_54]
MPEVFSSSQAPSDSPTLDATKEVLRGLRKKRVHRRQGHNPVQVAASQKMPDRHHKRKVDEYSEVMSREKYSSNPVTAFLTKPLKTFFASQSREEEIILLLRKHPITQIRWVLTTLVLAVLPILFINVELFSFFPGNYMFAARVGWYLLLLGFSIESFLSWFFNVYIITDERIVDVDFLSLIYRSISSAKIDNIEDVSAETSGALRSVFDFGTVRVQTAAEKTEFEFEDVPQPNKVIALINDLLLEEEREKVEGRVS